MFLYKCGFRKYRVSCYFLSFFVCVNTPLEGEDLLMARVAAEIVFNLLHGFSCALNCGNLGCDCWIRWFETVEMGGCSLTRFHRFTFFTFSLK